MTLDLVLNAFLCLIQVQKCQCWSRVIPKVITGQQKQTVKKPVVKKRARDESKWKRNIAKKRKAEGKAYIGIKNKIKCLKPERKSGKNCNCTGIQMFQKNKRHC
ncbi:hypothetical protein QE152_g30226 [Popillia japonica]|uniref:Secreted protein n=1 Tax=Popillia japonica TaxID=7064 RepID=A0AAW1JF60_POPJA